MITLKEVKAFTQGDCWRLARALHDAAGYQIYAIGDVDDAGEPAGERYWYHMVVQVSEGLYLDVNGIQDIVTLAERWAQPWDTYYKDFDMFPLTPEQWEMSVIDQDIAFPRYNPEVMCDKLLSIIRKAVA